MTMMSHSAGDKFTPQTNSKTQLTKTANSNDTHTKNVNNGEQKTSEHYNNQMQNLANGILWKVQNKSMAINRVAICAYIFILFMKSNRQIKLEQKKTENKSQ